MLWTLQRLIYLAIWFGAIVSNQGIQHFINTKEISEKTQQRFLQNMQNNKNYIKPLLKPIRITFNTSQLDIGLSKVKRDQIHQILEAVKSLFEKMIKVVPIVGRNQFQSNIDSCISITDLKQEKEVGIQNSDLHIFVSHYSEVSDTIAEGSACSFIYINSKNIKHPNFGFIAFNTENFLNYQSDPKSFQNIITTVIHEFIHVLGFQRKLFSFWFDRTATGEIQTYIPSIIQDKTIKGEKVTILKSPNILKIARKYFGSATLVGIPLDKVGLPSEIYSHWDSSILETDILHPYRVHDGKYFTVITAGALMDSGFWDLINQNFAYPIEWATNKCCNINEWGCQSTDKCQTEKKQIFANGEDPNTLCTPTVSSRDVCIDLRHTDQTSRNSLNDFGFKSKCFVSDLLISNQHKPQLQMNRCHLYECSDDQTKITIRFQQLPGFLFTCGPNDFSLQKPVIYKGQSIGSITCPRNYNKFCDYKFCRNYCSSKGICVRGYCHCFPGYTGDDCSEKCSEQPGNQKCEKTCPKGTFSNPDRTCRKTCPFGYYQNPLKNQCQLCDFSCSKCSGPLESQCTACQYLTYLYKKQCFKTCPIRTYNDESTMTCVECPIGCLSCKNGQSCQTCMKNHDLDKGLCVNSICKSKNCNTCLIENNIQCTSCPRGTFLDSKSKSCVLECPLGTWRNLSNNTCSACPTGCTKCDSAIKCLVCDIEQGYMLYGKTCTTCASNCQSCDPTNLSYCTSCKSGQILHFNMCVNGCPESFYKSPNNSCLPCRNGCKNCNRDGSCNKSEQNKLLMRSNSSYKKK